MTSFSLNNRIHKLTKLLGGLIVLSGLLFPSNIFGQSSSANVNLEKLDENRLSKELLLAINEFRREQELPLFELDKKLSMAASDQAAFNRKIKQVSSEQFAKKKITVSDRVKLFGGQHYKTGEYDIGIEIDTKNRLMPSASRKKKPSTYVEIAEYIKDEWLDERRLNELMQDPEFFKVGIGWAAIDEDGILFATVVLGSEEYTKIATADYPKKDFKITPYTREICNVFQRDYAYLPELLSNNLRFEGRKIVFYYHDLSLIESIFESNKDMMAVDIMTKDQFSCNHGNQLYPSKVSDGLMLKPIKKNALLKRNLLKEAKEFRAVLGQLPAGVDTADLQLALLIIKNKCMCTRVAFNNMHGVNIRYLNVGLAIDTLSISQSIDSNSRYLKFTVPFEKNKYDYEVEDIKPFLDSIELNRFNIVDIQISAFSSIEGNYKSNMELQDRRAKSILKAIGEYQLQEVKTKITTQENWDGFYESIKGSDVAEVFQGSSKEDIRGMVNSDTLKFDMEPYLEGQRKADISITVESVFIDSLTPEVLPEKFDLSVKEKDHIRSKALQTLLYRAVLDHELNTNVLLDSDIPHYAEYVDLLNNQLAFRLEFYDGPNRDSLINDLRMQFEALLGISSGNGPVNFNKQAIKLYYWAKDLNFLIIDEEGHVDQVKDFYKDIRKLYNTKIDNYKVNRLLLNYNIIAADFYYERQDYRNRIKALKQVKRYVLKAKLSRQQTHTMALYFIYQMQIDWAIQIMQPFIKSDDYNADFLMTFLDIAIYDEKHVKPEIYLQYTQAAAKQYPEEFCRLFGKSGMSIEFLRDLGVKSVYCNTCH